MQLDMKTLRRLLRTLAEGGVSTFSYEDADIKLKIVRGPAAASSEQAAAGPGGAEDGSQAAAQDSVSVEQD